jgi:hypothetical protein
MRVATMRAVAGLTEPFGLQQFPFGQQIIISCQCFMTGRISDAYK